MDNTTAFVLENTLSNENADVSDEVLDEDVISEESVEEVQSDELEVLQARIAELEAESTKQRNIKKKIAKERDELNANRTTESDDNDVKYKELFEQTNKKLEAIQSKARDSEVNAAITAQLTKAGIRSDALAAGVKLVDKSIIEYDDDEGIDSVSVDAAVQLLRGTASFMFEDKVKPTTTRQPANKTSATNEMTRADFDKLPLEEQREKMLKGLKITE